MGDVRDFGAVGDGQVDDTQAIQHAIDEGDGDVLFSPGTYLVRRTITVDLNRTGWRGLRGAGGAARIVMQASGPALKIVGTHRGTADPDRVEPPVWQSERMPLVCTLEIVGDHPEADGVQLLRTMQATLDRILVRNVRHAVHLRERNRNVLLNALHLYDNSGVGVFIDRCNLHQMIISACHISYNCEAGIYSRDGDLHNLQITGNDIEYNYDPASDGGAEIWFDCREGVASEITVASNTIQARIAKAGANVRIDGNPQAPDATARLIAVTGNVIGHQSTNLAITAADRVTITGNTIYDGEQNGILATKCTNLVVSNNTFGWFQGPRRQMADNICLNECRLGKLHGLTMANTNSRPDTDAAAIDISRCHNIAVSDCQLHAPGETGIRLADSDWCRIDSNTIIEANDRPLHAAIEVRGTGGNHAVMNNLIAATTPDAVRCPDKLAVVQGNVVDAARDGNSGI